MKSKRYKKKTRKKGERKGNAKGKANGQVKENKGKLHAKEKELVK